MRGRHALNHIREEKKGLNRTTRRKKRPQLGGEEEENITISSSPGGVQLFRVPLGGRGYKSQEEKRGGERREGNMGRSRLLRRNKERRGGEALRDLHREKGKKKEVRIRAQGKKEKSGPSSAKGGDGLSLRGMGEEKGPWQRGRELSAVSGRRSIVLRFGRSQSWGVSNPGGKTSRTRREGAEAFCTNHQQKRAWLCLTTRKLNPQHLEQGKLKALKRGEWCETATADRKNSGKAVNPLSSGGENQREKKERENVSIMTKQGNL